MPEKTQKQMIQEIYQTTTQLSTVLIGIPDTESKGLVGEVKDVKINLNELGKSHGRLKKNFWILVGALAGSGILGTGIYGLLNGG